MRPLTVADLYNACEQQMLKGNGQKIVMVTNDEECNGYHELWYTFTDDANELAELDKCEMIRGYNSKDIVAIG